MFGLAAWIGRWLALEVAVRFAQRRPPPERAPKDALRPPGRMPGPFD
ncbi:MAG TPA: hypothetical protein VF877_10150 [Gaiellaceae bacterium]